MERVDIKEEYRMIDLQIEKVDETRKKRAT
jgi:hypothetical protein